MPGKSRARQIVEEELRDAARVALAVTQSRYSKALDRRANGYALLGYGNDEIAELLGVDRNTFAAWIVEQPTLARALQSARVDAPVAVVRSLHLAARGFKHRETKLNVVNGKVEKTEVTRRYAPNVTAAQFILGNRVSQHWKDTKTVDHTGRIDLAALVRGSMGDDAKVIEAKPERQESDG